jgi:hypothetical protein
MVYKPTSNWRHLVNAFPIKNTVLPGDFPNSSDVDHVRAGNSDIFRFNAKTVALLKGNNPKKSKLNAHMLCLKNDWKAPNHPNLQSFERQASVDCTGRCGPSGAKACQRHVLKKSKNDLCPFLEPAININGDLMGYNGV